MMSLKSMKIAVGGLLALGLTAGYASTVVIPMSLTSPSPQQDPAVGTVVATDTPYGLMLTPHLSGLVPYLSAGPHGFHVHVNPSCANKGMAAGGHFDPSDTNHHGGPYVDNGHGWHVPICKHDTSLFF